MGKKIMIFAGAPENSALEWEGVQLLDHFLGPLAAFSKQPELSSPLPAGTDPASSSDNALWRSIPLHRARLEFGFSQVHEIGDWHYGHPDFFETASLSGQSASELPASGPMSQSILHDFYDYSLAIHDDIPSSQLPPGSGSFNTTTSSFNTTDGISIDDSRGGAGSSPAHDVSALETSHLSDLEDIPKASYLESISPQTMTVNLIVGIISIAEPRTVKTRWGSSKTLVELLVGDETKSGFTITFWLPSESDSKPQDSKTAAATTEVVLRRLRRQDIVLLRNVALGAFMKKVHGHSLRKGLTKVSLLHRKKLDKDDMGGLYSIRQLSSKNPGHPQIMKTKRVWEWAVNFVGGGGGGGGTSLGKRKGQGGRSLRSWDVPPPDTQ
ncbi:hypothetical protein SLS62_003478 [Diatrype stigma]|uniref:Uncharacterized protein n=1 Tax=Diatrype stigma TaxID=117547 RepID=A0AAN9YPU7_9PEZI